MYKNELAREDTSAGRAPVKCWLGNQSVEPQNKHPGAGAGQVQRGGGLGADKAQQSIRY